LSAVLDEAQSLTTFADGLSASSEVTFFLNLTDFYGNPLQNFASPLLYFDDPLSIGPNSALSDASTPTLTASVMLQGDTPYYLYTEADIEVYGATAPTPEPSSLLLMFSGLIFFCVLTFIRGGWFSPGSGGH
jgi:hypothetical protein